VLPTKTPSFQIGTPPPSSRSGKLFRFCAVGSAAAFFINSKLGMWIESAV